MKIRTYSELIKMRAFDERFDYLKLGGEVGRSTFGYDRYLNQQFYRSLEWQQVRDYVILRDDGCDLGVPGHEIHAELLVHHINPMTAENIIHGDEWILDPEFLITTSHRTHNAIHYGAESLIPKTVTERKPRDTALW